MTLLRLPQDRGHVSEGTLGPDLTEAGKKCKIDYLWESIVEPRANLATSFMPQVQPERRRS